MFSQLGCALRVVDDVVGDGEPEHGADHDRRQGDERATRAGSSLHHARAGSRSRAARRSAGGARRPTRALMTPSAATPTTRPSPMKPTIRRSKVRLTQRRRRRAACCSESACMPFARNADSRRFAAALRVDARREREEVHRRGARSPKRRERRLRRGDAGHLERRGVGQDADDLQRAAAGRSAGRGRRTGRAANVLSSR